MSSWPCRAAAVPVGSGAPVAPAAAGAFPLLWDNPSALPAPWAKRALESCTASPAVQLWCGRGIPGMAGLHLGCGRAPPTLPLWVRG